jgi:hypothetical protein
MDIEEVSWECIDWIDLAQDRDKWWALVNKVLNQWVP